MIHSDNREELKRRQAGRWLFTPPETKEGFDALTRPEKGYMKELFPDLFRCFTEMERGEKS